MDAFSQGDLRIDVEDSDTTVRLLWRGKSTARNPSELLQPYFAQALAEVAPPGAPSRSLCLEFERLDHFNSSTIAALIQLVHHCRARGVKLVLTFDGRLKWQQLSFGALRVLAKPDGLLEVRSIA